MPGNDLLWSKCNGTEDGECYQCYHSTFKVWGLSWGVCVSVLHVPPHVSDVPGWWCHAGVSWSSIDRFVISANVRWSWAKSNSPALVGANCLSRLHLWIQYNHCVCVDGREMVEEEIDWPYEPVWDNVICVDWCSGTRHRGHIHHSCYTRGLMESASLSARNH